MNIGEAANRSGVSAKMIRYYESVALIAPADRSAAGYRRYGDTDIHRLRFIRRARDLGFSIEKITTLLGLWGNSRRSSAKVKELALLHIAELKQQIAIMQAVLTTLEHLAKSCHGDDRPECPIIDDLAHKTCHAPSTLAQRRKPPA
jgi:Cu(I)-responsive transcriptional regulator